VKSKPRNSKKDWHEVQTGIKGYYDEVRTCFYCDRFIKNKCNQYYWKDAVLFRKQIITKTDSNPNKAAAKNRSKLCRSVEDDEEEKRILEFNNRFSQKKGLSMTHL